MKSDHQDDGFFQKSMVEILPGCFCRFAPVSGDDGFAVCGVITSVSGRQRGIFKGGRVIAFTTGKDPEPGVTLQLPPENVFPVPDTLPLKAAAAAAVYLNQINAIRESAVPLCSNYALTAPDPVFEAVLPAMGYIPTDMMDADLIVDTDGSLSARCANSGVCQLCWHRKTETGETAPGADWDAMKNGNPENLKFSEAYVRTRVVDNLKTYFALAAGGKLEPDTTGVVVLTEEPESAKSTLTSDLSAFHPYENLIAGRRKPMIIVWMTGDRKETAAERIRKADTWIGCTHGVCHEISGDLKLGYPDGSIADLLYNEGQSEHIELHFDGVTVVCENGTVKKY